MILSKSLSNKIDTKELANLSLFSLGKFVSLFGTAIYTFAMSLYVLKQTGSGMSFATNMILGLIPVILVSPVAGVLADRFNRKYLVVSMDCLNGLLLLGLYYLSRTEGLSIQMIYGTTFIMTLFTVIFGTSLEAAKPNMVSESRLMTINAISKIIESASSIVAPMLGGVIYAMLDIRFFILVNGISFVLSGVSEMLIDFNYQPQKKREQTEFHILQDIKEGLHYLKSQKQVIHLLSIFISMNFFISLAITVPFPFIMTTVLKLRPEYFGMIEGAFPVGMILGALMVKKVSEKVDYYKLLLWMSANMALCMIMLGVPLILFGTQLSSIIYLIYYSLLATSLGITIAFVDIPIMYILQKSIEDAYRGRVLSLVMSIVKIVAPIALILSGFFMNHLHPWVLPTLGGILSMVGISILGKNQTALDLND